jgi:hypothetical protein
MTEIIERDEIIAFLMENYDGSSCFITVEEGNANDQWTVADLFLRRWLNDMDDAPGWGLTNVKGVYEYLCKHKTSLIAHNMVNRSAKNNSGFLLWENHEFDN